MATRRRLAREPLRKESKAKKCRHPEGIVYKPFVQQKKLRYLAEDPFSLRDRADNVIE
jgi:hypothetical protein